jgi:hypothetical protein
MQDSSDPTPGLPRSAPPIYAEQVVARPVETPPKNRLGVVAFVFSILGVTCLPVIGGVVGLICGIIAVRREPRGLSIAAIVISVVGGCLLMPLLLLPALLLPALAKARAAAQGVQNSVLISMTVEDFRAQNGRLPGSLDEAFPTGVPLDRWGNPYVLKVSSDPNSVGYQIWSAGPDATMGTADDEAMNSFVPTPNGAEDDSTSDSSTDAGAAEESDGEGPGDSGGDADAEEMTETSSVR